MPNNYKIIYTTLLGNVIEYFGFTLFAIFTSEIGQYFFPQLDHFLQSIYTLMIFGTGFITRPFGAVFFGHFGDKIGRKKSLNYTILGMSIVTLLIAIIPDYQVLGIISPILLIVLRLLQGFFVGGEGPGAALYMLEHSQISHRGQAGGVIIASIVTGSLLAVLVGILISKLGISESFSWRIPFAIASLAGFISAYLRLNLPETKDFIYIQKQNKILKTPIIEIFKNHWKEIILITSLSGMVTSLAYMIMAYIGFYIENSLGISHIIAMQYSLYTIFVHIIFLIFLGTISNHFEPKKFIKIFSYLIILFLIPIFLAINSENKILFFGGLSLLAALAAGITAPSYPYAISKFSPEVRSSGVGVSYTLGIAIFGGFSPVICTYLIKITQLTYSPAFYIMTLVVLYIALEYSLFKRRSNDFHCTSEE